MPQWFWVTTVMLYFTLSLESWVMTGEVVLSIMALMTGLILLSMTSLMYTTLVLWSFFLHFLSRWMYWGGTAQRYMAYFTSFHCHRFETQVGSISPRRHVCLMMWCPKRRQILEPLQIRTSLINSFSIRVVQKKKLLFVYLSSFSTVYFISYSFDCESLFLFQTFLKFYPFSWKRKGK